jgi:hypothetical protein
MQITVNTGDLVLEPSATSMPARNIELAQVLLVLNQIGPPACVAADQCSHSVTLISTEANGRLHLFAQCCKACDVICWLL